MEDKNFDIQKMLKEDRKRMMKEFAKGFGKGLLQGAAIAAVGTCTVVGAVVIIASIQGRIEYKLHPEAFKAEAIEFWTKMLEEAKAL